ncbi:tetratricopeptide repeat protein [Catenulispora pinisilvae]|uniref:tetratricopeptide repeat protein n=1 Tax=Catenulispora pinisilvae TaxID=2705253 RepID=UPI0034DDAE25
MATVSEGLAALQGVDDAHGAGFTLHNLGEAYLGANDPAAALDAFNESLAIRLDTGNPWGEARTRLGLGKALLGLGRIEDAIARCDQARELFQDHGTPVDTANVALVTAAAHTAIGDIATARKTLFEATWLLGPDHQRLAQQLEAALDTLGTA